MEEKNIKLEPKTLDELKTIVEKYINKHTKLNPKLKKPKIVYYRELKNAWGICSKSKDKLTFHPLMKYFPEKYIEFVVYHELIHTYCLNHNPPFYNEMKKLYPDWRMWDHELHLLLYLLDINEIYAWEN